MRALVLLFKEGIAGKKYEPKNTNVFFHLLFSCCSASIDAQTEASDKVMLFCLFISKIWLVFVHRCVIWLVFTILIVLSIKILMWLLLLFTLALFSRYLYSLELILNCSYLIALGFVFPVTALILGFLRVYWRSLFSKLLPLASNSYAKYTQYYKLTIFREICIPL